MLIASCTFILHTSRFQASFRVKFEFNDDEVDGGGILQQHGKVCGNINFNVGGANEIIFVN